jgi:polar amino acid transport system substrate-binding protein
MRRGKTRMLVALTLAAIAASIATSVGCGGGTGSSKGSGDLKGTAAERAATILGREPTGLAKEIVDRGEIVVANDAHYPPLSSVDSATKEPVGFDVDVANGVADILGLRVAWKHPVWETVPSGLRRGLYDVSIGSMPVTTEGKQRVAFTDPYYYTSGQVFVRKGGSQITGAADLDGRDVGATAATTYWEWLKANTTAAIMMYASDLDALDGLATGKVDFWLTSGATGQQYIVDGKPIESSGPPLYYQGMAFATKSGESDLIAMLDFAISAMRENGTLSKMSKKWFNGVDLTVRS